MVEIVRWNQSKCLEIANQNILSWGTLDLEKLLRNSIHNLL